MQEAGFARHPKLEPNSKSMMKTKLTLFVAVLALCLQNGYGQDKAKVDPFLLKKGLVAHYPFNGNSVDESDSGNHAGVNGARFAKDKQGKSNRAYAFDGDDTIVIPENMSFEEDAHTLSLWINSQPTEQLTQDAVLIAKDGNRRGQRQWQLNGKRDKRIGTVLWGADGSVALHSKSLYQIGGWTHVLQTWDGKTLKLYMNGVMDAQTKAAGPLATGDSPVIIGKLGVFAFKGLIDDVRIYNRALSAAEVKALYDLEKPKTK
jgi:hypothetical protein